MNTAAYNRPPVGRIAVALLASAAAPTLLTVLPGVGAAHLPQLVFIAVFYFAAVLLLAIVLGLPLFLGLGPYGSARIAGTTGAIVALAPTLLLALNNSRDGLTYQVGRAILVQDGRTTVAGHVADALSLTDFALKGACAGLTFWFVVMAGPRRADKQRVHPLWPVLLGLAFASIALSLTGYWIVQRFAALSRSFI